LDNGGEYLGIEAARLSHLFESLFSKAVGKSSLTLLFLRRELKVFPPLEKGD
jgi:hypothetical protein